MATIGTTARHEVGSGPPLAAPGRRGVPPWVWRTLALYAATRAVVAAVFGAVPVLANSAIKPFLTRWDSLWYLSIARYGYPHTLAPQYAPQHGNSLAFFPAYPLLVRAAGVLTGGHQVLAGYLLNVVLGASAVLLVRTLFADLAGEQAADRGAGLFVTFPGAVVLSLAYAEALTITLAAACLLALQRRWWLVAGLAGGLAGASRPNALPLMLSCLWAAGAAVAQRREWRALVAPVLAPLGALAFLLWSDAITGVPFAYQVVERRYWGQHLDFPTGLLAQIRLLHRPVLPGDKVEVLLILLGTAFLLLALVALVRARLPAPVLLYTLGVLGLCLAYSQVGARPRFLLTAFPVFLALGLWFRGAVYQALLAAGSGLGAVLLVLYLMPVHLTP